MSLEQYKDSTRKELWEILQIQADLVERLERISKARSSTICEYSHIISDLQKDLDNVCVTVFDNRGKTVTTETLNVIKAVASKFKLPLKVNKQ
tara:strand:- start:437 stop:715 length:279 start_codon:yes stop_codon:yes gene_type:complete